MKVMPPALTPATPGTTILQMQNVRDALERQGLTSIEANRILLGIWPAIELEIHAAEGEAAKRARAECQGIAISLADAADKAITDGGGKFAGRMLRTVASRIAALSDGGTPEGPPSTKRDPSRPPMPPSAPTPRPAA